MKYFILIFSIVATLGSCRKVSVDPNHAIMIDSLYINNIFVANNTTTKAIDYEKVVINLRFKEPVDTLLFDPEKIK
jgi:hypothetical protein